MCGISGFIDFSQGSSIQILKNMMDSLSHRGPDGNGCEFINSSNAQVGLSHTRLSIIDLSNAAKQPMVYNDLWITFNGEIYNFKQIKNELIELGHTFISESDTEVVLHAYQQWGIKCVDKFIGMFAFVIFDIKNQELICIRDRTGVKPLFYYWNEGLFLFASELKAFHQHPKFKKEINVNALAAFMQFGNVPSDLSIFKYCNKLSAASHLRFNLQTQQLKTEKYWSVYGAYNKPKLQISFNEAKQETEKLLHSAFNYRMIADVPVGVFLSGGYDSACLTAMLQKNNLQKINTFTIAVPDIGLNEAEYAKEIAAHLGTNHQTYTCTQNEALAIIDFLPFYYDEPFADSSAIPTMLLSKMAKKDVTVVLSADGGDEVFAGYNRYDYLMKHGKLLNQIPKFVRKTISNTMKYIPANSIPVLKNKYNFHNRYEKLKNLLQNPSPKNMMQSLSNQFSDSELLNLMRADFVFPFTPYLSEELKPDYFTSLSYMMAIDYETYLPDDILQKVDRASMSASLEAREPYLDYRIIEWAAQLPDSYKYNHGIKKFILKEITHHYIPKKLMDRPKMGFAIPIEDWLMQPLKEKVMYYLNSKRIKNQGIFNDEPIQKIIHSFYTGKKEMALKVWYLLMFQMWHEKWMEQ